MPWLVIPHNPQSENEAQFVNICAVICVNLWIISTRHNRMPGPVTHIILTDKVLVEQQVFILNSKSNPLRTSARTLCGLRVKPFAAFAWILFLAEERSSNRRRTQKKRQHLGQTLNFSNISFVLNISFVFVL